MRLLLIRHAESIHNQSAIIAGPRGCPGLTARGFEQARRMADHLGASGQIREDTVLLSSPALRARQTAETLLPLLPVQNLVLEPDLLEQLPGDADGMTRAAYHQTYGEYNAQEAPDRPFAPGGESWNEFLRRVQSAPERLAERYPGKTVVAVTHAGFIVISFLRLFAVPLEGSRAWIDPDFTGITEWAYTGSVWRLVRYNDTAHLRNW